MKFALRPAHTFHVHNSYGFYQQNDKLNKKLPQRSFSKTKLGCLEKFVPKLLRI